MSKRIFISILMLAFCLRAAMVYVNIERHPDLFTSRSSVISQKIADAQEPFLDRFGYEVSNIAYSLICKGEGYSSPFGGSTGATVWVAPLLVMLYALAFYLCGCFTKGAIIFIFIVSIILSILMVWLVYLTSLKLSNNSRCAIICSFLFAICPQDVLYLSYAYQQDFNVYAFFFILTFFAFLKWYTTQSKPNLLFFSCIAALAVLSTPVMILPIMACIIWLLFSLRKHIVYTIKNILVCFCVLSMIVAPYVVYQKKRIGTWCFIKSNGPFEVYFGNTPESDGLLTAKLFEQYHPGSNTIEFQAYRDMGEAEYIALRYRSFIDNFELSKFLKVSAKRFLNFFFIYKPYIPDYRFDTWRLLFDYIVYAIPGISLLIYIYLSYRTIDRYDALMFFYILSYALPYCFFSMMYRYSFPVSTLTTIFLGRSICILMDKYRNRKPR